MLLIFNLMSRKAISTLVSEMLCILTVDLEFYMISYILFKSSSSYFDRKKAWMFAVIWIQNCNHRHHFHGTLCKVKMQGDTKVLTSEAEIATWSNVRNI